MTIVAEVKPEIMEIAWIYWVLKPLATVAEVGLNFAVLRMPRMCYNDSNFA